MIIHDEENMKRKLDEGKRHTDTEIKMFVLALSQKSLKETSKGGLRVTSSNFLVESSSFEMFRLMSRWNVDDTRTWAGEPHNNMF